MHRSNFFVVIGLGVVSALSMTVGCKQFGGDFSSTENSVNQSVVFTQASQKLWASYISSLQTSRIQADCMPRYIPAAKGVPERGIFLAYHGYTACPQQYFELGEKLAAKGYHVLSPLLPGHGYKFNEKNQDDIRDLPMLREWKEYTTFAKQMDAIVKAGGGDKVVMGLSVGGAVAANSGAAKGIYNRQLLSVPMFEMSFGFDPVGSAVTVGLIAASRAYPLLEKLQIGWGKNCKTTERIGVEGFGRAGVCDFLVSNLSSVSALGKYTARVLEEMKDSDKIVTQFVGVEGDGAVNTTKTAQVFRKYSAGFLNSKMCNYPKGVPHSFLSRADNPNEDKFWLERSMADIVNFVVDGTFFPALAEKNAQGISFCHTK